MKLREIPSRALLAMCAVAGILLGAGALGSIQIEPRYQAEANVALLPATDLTMAEASGFWEVLTRGQINRVAAIIYGEDRWRPSAAATAGTAVENLTLTAGAIPETTMVRVTAEAGSAAAAEAALTNLLQSATPEVESVSAPFDVRIMWPPEHNATPVTAPTSIQLVGAGAVAGALTGIGAGVLLLRLRRPDDRPNGLPVNNRARHTV